ncbi:MAG: acetylxylan esterase [Gemmataceae bacterium]|nr:acetylxylan esterase [Gemmataceae bacterium]MDW8265093.1 acetylxylan esterase [Gemmataceae bacterium]
MKRFSLLAIFVAPPLMIAAGHADGQPEELRVLPAAPPGTPSALYQYLLREAEAAIDRRTQAWDQIATVEQARRWQQERRDIFLRALGPFPERTPLNARVVATLEGDGCRIEKVIYESRPRHRVTATLYLPLGAPPYPAVLVPCGHSADGKASASHQLVCTLLARNGLAALCYDPIGQGERYQCFGRDGRPLPVEHAGRPAGARQLRDIPGQPLCHCVEEHTLMGIGAMLVGTNTALYRIWDGMRSIDYLVSRPDIDPKRIGCTGNSGGGTLTSYLMALDDRIYCAAPVCYLTTFRRLLRGGGPQDAEQNLFGQLAHGLDEADYVHIRAPKPTAILAGTRDSTFDILGTWDIFREAKRFYARFDHPERVDLVETDAPHGFSPQLRVGAVRWMRRWLLGQDDAITEPPLKLRPASDLWCTPRGQVLFLPDERSVFDLNRERAATLAKQRAALWKNTPPDAMRERIRVTLGVKSWDRLPPAQHRAVGTVRRDGYDIQKLVLTTELDLPALLFVPQQPSGEAYLYVHGDGKEADAGPQGPIDNLARKGHLVLAVDLSGMGETERRHPRDWGRSMFGPNTQEYFLAYLLGRSLVGMWTEEIWRCGRFLASHRAHDKPRRIHLVGVGNAGVPAWHAAALEPERFASVTLRQTLTSWTSVVETPMAGTRLPLTVPGALAVYDLPDLELLIGQDRVKIEEPRNAAGRPVAHR